MSGSFKREKRSVKKELDATSGKRSYDDSLSSPLLVGSPTNLPLKPVKLEVYQEGSLLSLFSPPTKAAPTVKQRERSSLSATSAGPLAQQSSSLSTPLAKLKKRARGSTATDRWPQPDDDDDDDDIFHDKKNDHSGVRYHLPARKQPRLPLASATTPRASNNNNSIVRPARKRPPPSSNRGGVVAGKRGPAADDDTDDSLSLGTNDATTTTEERTSLEAADEDWHPAAPARPKPGDAAYTPLFVVDNDADADGVVQSSRRTVHSSTIRQLLYDEADSAAAAVPRGPPPPPPRHQSSLRPAAADRLCRAVAERVRRRLRTAPLPAAYARAVDANFDRLAAVNRRRQTELSQSALRLRTTLRAQRLSLAAELAQEEARHERLRDALRPPAAAAADPTPITHALLRAAAAPPPARAPGDGGHGGDDRTSGTPQQSQPPNAAAAVVRSFGPAPPGTMARVCEAMLRDSRDHQSRRRRQQQQRAPS